MTFSKQLPPLDVEELPQISYEMEVREIGKVIRSENQKTSVRIKKLRKQSKKKIVPKEEIVNVKIDSDEENKQANFKEDPLEVAKKQIEKVMSSS